MNGKPDIQATSWCGLPGSHEGFHTTGLGIRAVRTPEAIHKSIIFIHKHARMYMARYKQVNARTLPLLGVGVINSAMMINNWRSGAIEIVLKSKW